MIGKSSDFLHIFQENILRSKFLVILLECAIIAIDVFLKRR
ncbi:hypothetical protein STRINF_01946 [Streptococcus infantarius subsp. infantarius ATCC BAA-102]|uniref:Uncharacterized protein n=1 Tax=Streptococcus infantarius subsp. infantarius ATCC BAA-102 TaxID=471872 RepID=A0ABP2DFD1_9STRE|nr:hypothetical protein STRINF_01946 [Streptococcus infantarius subsp. infantarius ATCC BAA-102]